MLLGATRPKTDMTTASVEESFYIKTERNPRSIKLKFHLKDQDHMTDDDLLGHVSKFKTSYFQYLIISPKFKVLNL